MKHRTVIIGGNPVEVAWSESGDRIEATVNGRTYNLEKKELGPGAYWFGWAGGSVEVLLTERDGAYEASIHGRRIRVEAAESGLRKRGPGSADDKSVAEIRAPMPGKIVRVLLGQGEDVKAREGIVVMEAMKMQNEIRSPKRGKILELRVAEGDAVNMGDVIARVG